jgi:Polysaccharide deacetylase
LDFELLWGMRDHHDKASYGKNILGVRRAIPEILDRFDKVGIRATWATVGMLMCESKDELLFRMPTVLPVYSNMKLSNYEYLNEVGGNEKTDPYYFGNSLFNLVRRCAGQEVGTHTFSHYYCRETGQKNECFRADLMAAIQQLNDRGIEAKSIVFPRNQYTGAALEICAELGLSHFRGTETGFLYETRSGTEEKKLRRLARLADAYLNISGENTGLPQVTSGLINVPSSRFLRPFSKKLNTVEVLRLRRITNGMQHAAENGKIFHLWWHPHNFGSNLTENLLVLDAILDKFTQLHGSFGFTSCSMGDIS